MKINSGKIIVFTMVFMLVLTFFQTTSLSALPSNPSPSEIGGSSTGTSGGSSGEKLDTDYYKTDVKYDDAAYIFDKGGQLLTVIRNIAAIVSVITISIIGLRYMVGSVEQRAEYKQTMFPVVVGCILIGSLSVILTLIQSIF